MSNEDVVELGIDECWAMLRTPDLCRADVPDRRRSAHHAGELRRRSAAAVPHRRGHQAARWKGARSWPFEVDEVTGGFARSVVVSGTARRLADDQAERAELTSWIASSPKYDVVEIIPRR